MLFDRRVDRRVPNPDTTRQIDRRTGTTDRARQAFLDSESGAEVVSPEFHSMEVI
jgi:hypothetical protein